MASTRRLAAIMFTDITGYSAMMEADELRAKLIRNRHRDVFKEAHGRYEGKILQYFGDGTLSIFSSTASAVECAVEMQIEFRKHPEVPLRIGIHTGDIAYDDEGAYGDGVNIASRLEHICVPGGIFISAKVFDDIKNHAWLTAVSLGFFHLRNIARELEVFAVTSKGMEFPSSQEMSTWPERDAGAEPLTDSGPPRGAKKKGVAFLLALMLGVFGIHRFYLGQRGRGILHFALAFIALMITVNEDPGFPPIAVFGILGFLDAILLLAMPKVEFDYKYNKIKKEKKLTKPTGRTQKRRYTLDRKPKHQEAPAIVQGINLYKEERYEEAIRAFRHALEKDPGSSAAHFNLACSHSILRNAKDSYFHLAKAVEFGFNDQDRILEHEALTFLRAQPDFDAFRTNGFRVVEQLPSPAEPDILAQAASSREEILDQLELLGEQLERGEMTRAEFDLEKSKILRQ